MIDAARETNVTAAETQQLRSAHYNATLTAVLPVHSDLRILRVAPDGGLPPFKAGQFISVGLGNWETRVEGVDDENMDRAHSHRLAVRAYSISCSLLDDNERLLSPAEFPYLEFYVALVRHGQKRPPALTPRLFNLQPGDRLFVERHAAGTYTLDNVEPDNNVFLFATGTGEAPHNAMIAELLTGGHRGTIISVVSVRYLRDAAYRLCHEQIARRYSNYRYFVLATREPPEQRTSAFVCGGHLQDLIASDYLEHQTGVALDPGNSHVFLCGNSEMIGARHATRSSPLSAHPGSMLDLLLQRGFRLSQPQRPGNVHFERYW